MRYAIICAVCGFTLFAGCSSDDPVESHSVEVITVDPAFKRDVSIAMVELHNDLADWIINDDGSKSDPTYKAGSRKWETGTGKKGENVKTSCSRSYMEFDMKGHGPIRIETVYIAGETITVLLDAESKEAAMELHDAVLKKIRDRCVEK